VATVDSVGRSTAVGVVDMWVRLEPTGRSSHVKETTRGVEMRLRVPIPRRAIRDLARFGLFVGPGDHRKLPGKDRRSAGNLRLCCPKCTWERVVPSAMPPRHRPKCPVHNLASRC
jgi:hypothetical protein